MGNMHLVTGYAGEAHITAEDHASLNASIVGSGQYVFDKGNKLAASVVASNTVRVLDGDILMQGRHIRLAENTYVDLTIENGAQGAMRNDLIVARYTKNSGTGIEECSLVVIKGTAAASNPVDPSYTSGDIINDRATLNDMPLYRVPLNGLTIGELETLFTLYERDAGKHASEHATDGEDPITPDMIGAYNKSETVTKIQEVINTSTHASKHAKDGEDPITPSMIGAARIQTGSYTGKGMYGESNPASVTLDFVPLFFMVYSVTGLRTYNVGWQSSFIWAAGQTRVKVSTGPISDTEYYGNSFTMRITVSETNISWYLDAETEIEEGILDAEDAPYLQCNESGMGYSWIAIG